MAQPVPVHRKPPVDEMPHVIPAEFELAAVSCPPRNRDLPTLLHTDRICVGELSEKKLSTVRRSGGSHVERDSRVSQDSTCGGETFRSVPSTVSSLPALDVERVGQVEDNAVLQRVLSSYKEQAARQDVLRERAVAMERETERKLAMEAEERAAVQLRQAKMQEAARRRQDQIALNLFLRRHGFSSTKGKRRESFLLRYDYPLHIAVRLADEQIVRALLAQGVDETQKNSSGLTARMVAQRENKDGSHDEVLNMLAA